MKQISLFDGSERYIVDKPVRLIELFAGYGSQALALKYLGIPFESWRISEWAIPSIKAYRDLHHGDDTTDYSAAREDAEIKEWLQGRISSDYNKPLTPEQIERLGERRRRSIFNDMAAAHNLGSITKVSGTDLSIEDTDKYTYLMFYSFPCQDLSVAGKGAGCAKGSGTRSGTLWEVERILEELHAIRGGHSLPQVLVAENVPALLMEKNRSDFFEWLDRLESFGYHNYYQILNAKNYGIPQNRDRVFIVSILGDYYYDFPEKIPLRFRLKDFLENSVAERYYLKDEIVAKMIIQSEDKQNKGLGYKFETTDGDAGGGALNALRPKKDPAYTAILSRCGKMIDKETDIASTIMARDGKGFGNQPMTGVLVPHIAAMRGRNPDDPSDRRRGSPTKQRIEIGSDETSNTITSVQKDNLIVEPGCIVAGMLDIKGHEFIRRVHDAAGVSPTIPFCGGGGQQPKIVVVGNSVESGHAAGNVISADGIAPTVMENHVTVTKVVEVVQRPRGKNKGFSKKMEVCPTVTSNAFQQNVLLGIGEDRKVEEKRLRVRRLTEKECFRLMGVEDEDFSAAARHQSNSGKYHLAGDSIVTTVLMAIFGELFGVEWHDKVYAVAEAMTKEEKNVHD